MKLKTCFFGLLAAYSVAGAQAPLPATDSSLINLQTPNLLAPSSSAAAISLRYVGGYDKTIHGDLWYGFGIEKGFEVDLAGSFGKWNSVSLAGGGFIRFGGTDEELSVRYSLPISTPVTVQAGLGYVQTPAQTDRLAASLGVSAGYSPISKVRVYLNPRVVFLDRNSLTGIGLGASADLIQNISVIADWTPLITGENTINTQTGNQSRSELYSLGLRYSGVLQHGTVDFGVTNSSGITTGSSLTSTLGNAPSLFARLTYRF